ncbi:hypothetical protein JXA56_01195 [Candidatus Micrarchaeota archaeon]|nr:hypothetical protein [Candidatus Micrarchaeota archaeon]
MTTIKREKDAGYFLVVNARPSDQLLEKIRNLGWKSGQYVYWNRKNLELKFFNTREDLDHFLHN